MHAPFRVVASAAAARSFGARTLLALALAAALASWSRPSGAAPITGDLSIAGSLTLGASTIDFQPNAGGSGSVLVLVPGTGFFAPLVGTSGTILDLDASTAPVGAALSQASFLTLAGAPAFSLTLTSIANGIFSSSDCAAAPAPGQTCTPAASSLSTLFDDVIFYGPLPPPWNARAPAAGYLPALDLVNTGLGSTLSFAVSGTLANLTDSSTSDMSGVFTAQFAGLSYQELLGTLAQGGSVSAAYSASLHAVVPEPATGLLCSLGVAGLLLARRQGAHR
jgi:hypothetical protein